MQFHLEGFRVGDPALHDTAPAGTGDVDVLIIGCGPAGLTLAAQLAAFPEIRTRIVEQKAGPLELGIACRTMEMFNAFGFADRVMKEAYWVNDTTFWTPGDCCAASPIPRFCTATRPSARPSPRSSSTSTASSRRCSVPDQRPPRTINKTRRESSIMRTDKTCFTLAEVLERWRMPLVDLAYLAENAKIRLSVRVFGVPIEFGDVEETPEGGCFRVPSRTVRYNGLFDLHPCDAFRLFRDHDVMVSEFNLAGWDYARVARDSDAVQFWVADLLMRREERDRFEAVTGFQAKAGSVAAGGLSASQDYRRVCVGGKVYYFGPIQAKVMRALHAAAMSGDPGCSGKALLAAAGAKSRKMADVFKSKPDWLDLIESNGRGRHRLALR